MTNTPVFACAASAFTPNDRARHTELVHMLHTGALEELPNGFAFAFPVTAIRAAELTEFMLLERQCCPFLTLQVEVAPEAGPLRLRLTGADGVKSFLVHELGLST